MVSQNGPNGPKSSKMDRNVETKPKTAIGTFQASLNGGICVPVVNPSVVSKSEFQVNQYPTTSRHKLTHKSTQIISELVLECTLTAEDIHKSTLDLDSIFH